MMKTKEELEKSINDDAIKYNRVSMQQIHGEKVVLRARLLRHIFLYCRDYLYYLQKNIPANELKNESNEKNFFYTEEINDIGLDYSFIDRSFALFLQAEYIKTGKYPDIKDIGQEFGDLNPTQTLKRFWTKVRKRTVEEKDT